MGLPELILVLLYLSLVVGLPVLLWRMGEPDAAAGAVASPAPMQESFYSIRRGDSQFGPYSSSEVRAFLAEGRVVASDACFTPGMDGWRTVGEVFAGGSMGLARSSTTPVALLPAPPALHWGWLALLSLVTLGLLPVVWMFIQSAWVKRLNRRSQAPVMLAVAVVVLFVGSFVAGAVAASDRDAGNVISLIVQLPYLVLYQTAYFDMRRSMEHYFEKVAPLGLTLSGPMTFFFNMLYFQYHFRRLAEWKRTGVLPQ